MRRFVLGIAVLAGTVGAPRVLGQQPPSLCAVGQSARAALARMDLEALVRSSPSVQVRFPGVDPATPLGRAQAAATLRGFFRREQAAEVSLVSCREVSEGRGYVELSREIRGPSGRRVQQILLGYRMEEGTWRLVEVVAN